MPSRLPLNTTSKCDKISGRIECVVTNESNGLGRRPGIGVPSRHPYPYPLLPNTYIIGWEEVVPPGLRRFRGWGWDVVGLVADAAARLHPGMPF